MANIKENVYLNVYDLSNLNECLWNCGLGIYHTGIQIEDNEYSFGGIQGIYVCKPTSIIPLREKILLGQTNINYQKINEIIRDLQNDFYSERYLFSQKYITPLRILTITWVSLYIFSKSSEPQLTNRFRHYQPYSSMLTFLL